MAINYKFLAEQKVNNSEALLKYKHIIMYDWDNTNEHWQWVLSESEENIIEWAKEMDDSNVNDEW